MTHEASDSINTGEVDCASDAPVYEYCPKKIWPALGLLLVQLILPFLIISTVQTIASLVAFVFYLRTDEGLLFFAHMGTVINGSGPATMFDPELMNIVMRLFSDLMQTKIFLIAMATAYIVTIVVYLLIVRLFEKNTFRTLGLPFRGSGEKKNAILSYVKGLGLGALMMFFVFLMLLLTRQVAISGIGLSAASLSWFFLSLLMWIPQGASEEIMTRGYMMSRLNPAFGRIASVVITSLYFGILHTGNSGFSLVPFLNLILIAGFFALFSLQTNEIWTVCAAHSMWNFTQGNLLGLKVSGIVPAVSVIQSQETSNPIPLISGGGFGPEGGLAVTAVVLISLILLLISMYRKKACRTII